jgi:hypothetical protein
VDWSRSRCDRQYLAARGTPPHETHHPAGLLHSWGCSGLGQVRGSVVECRRTPQGGGFGGAKGFRVAVGIVFKAWHRKNDGVLECARQSAASTPLWSCPKRQTHSQPGSQSVQLSHEEPRNPQQGHLRPDAHRDGSRHLSPSPIPISVGRSVPAEPLNRLSAHRDGFALPSE